MAESRQPRTPTPQESERLEAMKRTWEQRKKMDELLGKIKTKLGVYSGKGGVGKTTVAVNLAVTLANQGYKVGLFDTDIDCPNVAIAIGVVEPVRTQDNMIFPPSAFGVKVLSMSFFQENPDEATIWRGPMLHNAITQLLQSTEWGELDYLIVDLPPGTSDVPLTIMQTLQLDGFVVVTTPQDLAKIDAMRSINMIRKLNVRVLGIVENFSGEIFGSGIGRGLATAMELPFLGQLELRVDYRMSGGPTVLVSEAVREEYENITNGVLRQLDMAAVR